MEKENSQLSFDQIRPFKDDEVKPAIQRLIAEPSFHTALRYVFPDKSTDYLLGLLNTIDSVSDFQDKIISHAVNAIIRSTTKGVRISGLENLNRSSSNLFISNHRDIVLDSALLNYLFFTESYPTTRIAIGNNLLQRPWIEDLVKLNKNFIVHRDVQARQAYDYSIRLSNYIRHSICEEHVSVWIAQKEGRTKNGSDQTQAGLLKMFAMSGEGEISNRLRDLRITPVSISYEIEPCGGMKAHEQFLKARDGKYDKAAGEDLKSMQSGIAKAKGKVQFHIGATISPEIVSATFENTNKNEAFRELAIHIDKAISTNYKLFPFNFVALDMLNQSSEMSHLYSATDVSAFHDLIHEELHPLKEDKADLLPHFLAIYANPVKNKLSFGLPL